MRAGPLELRILQRQLLVDGDVGPLGARAFDVLVVLVERRGSIVSKAELISAAWPHVAVEENNLQVQISALRRVLGPATIATVPGRGYQLTIAPGKVASVRSPDAIVSAPGVGLVPGRAETLLAVLPFDNLSNDPETQFFSDGVSEEILQRLARGAKLRVIGRTSSFQFHGAHKADAARILKCTHVLDGSIRRAGGRVRIVAHLVECASQTTLWSERFDRSLEDLFAVQDEISERIAGALHHAFSGVLLAPVDPATYDLFLRAIQPSLAPERIVASVGLLEEVTKRAPHFADAWGRLAQHRAYLHYFFAYKDREAIGALVVKEVARALALDPSNPAARMADLMLLPPFGKFIEAGAAANRIMKDAPTVAYGLIAGVNHFISVGHVREAIELAQRAYELNALDPLVANFWGQSAWMGGRYSEARTRLESSLAQFPDVPGLAMLLLLFYAHAQDWDGVDRLLEPARLEKFPLREFQPVVRLLGVMRDPAPVARRRIINAARKRFDKTGHANLDALVYAAYLGAADEAHEIGARAKFGPADNDVATMGYDAYRTSILFYAPFPELRRDPRFVRLCAKLGLVEYWLATQHWPDCVDEVAPYYDFKAECEKIAHEPLKQDFGT